MLSGEAARTALASPPTASFLPLALLWIAVMADRRLRRTFFWPYDQHLC